MLAGMRYLFNDPDIANHGEPEYSSPGVFRNNKWGTSMNPFGPRGSALMCSWVGDISHAVCAGSLFLGFTDGLVTCIQQIVGSRINTLSLRHVGNYLPSHKTLAVLYCCDPSSYFPLGSFRLHQPSLTAPVSCRLGYLFVVLLRPRCFSLLL
ncbi:hypothetical protein BC826DRAFT_1052286 [Russula brevipes]|nr:hypothetical protein BC826DRAFT_1052286 [Russula brevipes]